MKTKLAVILVIILSMSITGASMAAQSDKAVYIGYCQEIAEKYGICPELIMAVCEHESNWNPDAVGTLGDTGLMQIVPKYHGERMQYLGVTDLTDPYSNILVGADYLAELATKYEDVAEALMVYNMGKEKAEKLYNKGIISEYATDILERSAEMERMDEK